MLKGFMNRVGCFFAFLLISQPVFSGGEGGTSKRITFEALSDYRSKGNCDYSVEDIDAHKREFSLLFMEDVLKGVTGNDSITKDIVGNINIFKVGRNVSPVLVGLYEYADRKDVRNQIISDAREMYEINSHFLSNRPFNSEKIIFCEMQKMLSGESYYFEGELYSYSRGLNQRILYRNLKNLNDLVEDATR